MKKLISSLAIAGTLSLGLVPHFIYAKYCKGDGTPSLKRFATAQQTDAYQQAAWHAQKQFCRKVF